METLTRADIAQGLRQLGLQAGDRVLVHASLVALGRVEGGADAVIDALLDAVGSTGLVVVPTFACPAPFDRHKSSTALGIVPETFWHRPEAVRSLHPTHSVAAIGKGAEELIRDHEKAPTAYGEGTPYCKLAMNGGKILLMGVDQDRNTTLHAAEALAGSPYLKDIEATYINDAGEKVTIPVAAMAGPHRDFIGLDRLFREKGVTTIGRIGNAVCRLMDAHSMLQTALEALRQDPAAVLCDNPACRDCVLQRGRIKQARIAGEEFTLAAVVGDISGDPDEVIFALRAEGIRAVELTAGEHAKMGKALADAGVQVIGIRSQPGDAAAAKLAADLGVPAVVQIATQDGFSKASAACGDTPWILENGGADAPFYEELFASGQCKAGLGFNPGGFAAFGRNPFLQVFYHGGLRSHTRRFYVSDGTSAGEPAFAAQGNGEVKEILSMLRCRSFSGVVVLRSHVSGQYGFRAAAAAFWRMLDCM